MQTSILTTRIQKRDPSLHLRPVSYIVVLCANFMGHSTPFPFYLSLPFFACTLSTCPIEGGRLGGYSLKPTL